MNRPKVFISYSHDSQEHAQRVRGLGASLSRDGCECRIDVYKDTDEDWPAWMTRQLLEADFILCVITETYERRFRDKELPGQGLGVGWEAGLIRRLLYAKKLHNDRIFPVAFAKSDRDLIPVELQGYDNFILDAPAGYESLLRKVLKRPAYAEPATGTPPALETSATAPLFGRPGEARSAATTFNADISHILKYAPAKLIGREGELKLLNEAWAKVQNNEKGRPRILTFVALGGEGKTALVAKWAAELAAQDWPGCDVAFAWSFYSQGTREQGESPSDIFLKQALSFLGDDADKAFAASPAGAFEKGQRLARLVGQRRSLLILDGLEPLQYAPTAPTPGELKDQGIAALLKGLAQNSHGLCIVTTRYSLPDLRAFWQTTAPEERLLRLSRDAGVHLLKTLGVKGSELRNISLKDGDEKSEKVNEFEKLVEDVRGHALTLTLLGGFLKRAFHGDIRQRDRVKFEKADEKMDGGHAFRALASYEQWLLRDGGKEGRREVAVLRLMGLFDRPADAGCLYALLQPPAIPGLTQPLVGIAEEDWNFSLETLASARVLTVSSETVSLSTSPFPLPTLLDAHPLLREYFATQLREKNPHTWRAAHRRLYEYLCASTKEGDQPTLEDLQPLYQAVAHGCHAGLQQEALDDVLFARIDRSDEAYSISKLGMFGAHLGAFACFFEKPWSKPVETITDADIAWVLQGAAFCLRAAGRMTEAAEPMRTTLGMCVTSKRWKNAASAVSNLSELEQTQGNVAGAVRDAEQSVTYADRSGDTFWRMGARTIHANALHQAGRRAEAETRLRKAEQMQKEMESEYPMLYSMQGFIYCDLLLADSERAAWQTILSINSQPSTIKSAVSDCRSVSQRSAQTLKWVMTQDWLLDIGLNHLTLGRAALYEAILEGRRDEFRKSPSSTAPTGTRETRPSNFETAHRELDAAVAGLRRAGTTHHIPRGLLTRAWLRFLTGAGTGPESAQMDLDESWEIAERGPMRLFMGDIHLYRARLFFQETPYPWESPAADLAAARKLIEQCGYWRRKEELEDAEGRLSQQRS